MNADDRLVSMIEACVEHEVREVRLPADFAERIIVSTGRRRRPKRFPIAVGMAVLTTAAAVVAAPVSLQFLAGPDPAPEATAALRPRALEGRVTVTVLPPGTGHSTRVDAPGGVEDGRSVWTVAYLREGPQSYVWIRVISGDVTLEGAAVEHYAPRAPGGREPVPVSRGEARAWSTGGHQNVVFQPEPGLVILVRGRQMSREEAVRIAEGVRVR
ncbi:hypothetical protein [Actinocorallia populi]|uniref:hypothetical protein n=1 Tax=Actinocorallia populi TaxID=2079200 RepID=UPI000D08E7EF|nr:hypothetical protein [Actinocorallia populi]